MSDDGNEQQNNGTPPTPSVNNLQNSSVVRGHRIVVGLLTLLLVDIIWVASSELTEFIYKTQHYSKPFFSTYLKTSLFMLYLPGFLIYKPWREQCQMGIQLRRLGSRGRGGGEGPGGEYRVIQESDDTDTEAVSDTADSEQEDGLLHNPHSQNGHVARSLSEPTFQPIRSEGTDSEVDTGLWK